MCRIWIPLLSYKKRAVRVIAGVQKYEHTDPLFRQMKILKLEQIYIYMVQFIMYKYHHLMLPSIFENFFHRNQDIHSHNTRIGNLFRPPFVRSDNEDRTIKVMGVRTWKYFSKHLCLDCSILSYKVSLKNHIIMYDVSLNREDSHIRIQDINGIA